MYVQARRIISNYFLAVLKDANIGRDLKTSALSTYGDLAMAIGPLFDKYIDITVGVLFQAGSIKIDTVIIAYLEKL